MATSSPCLWPSHASPSPLALLLWRLPVAVQEDAARCRSCRRTDDRRGLELEAVGAEAVPDDTRGAWARPCRSRRPRDLLASAIADDPPRNANVLESWAADLGELPASGVVTVIRDAVTTVVFGSEESEKLAPVWASMTDSLGNSSGNCQPNSSANKRGTPVPSPLPSPVPKPPPQPAEPEPETLTVYLRAFERLGPPFEYAAAAARLTDDSRSKLLAIPIGELGAALEGLATPFWASERARCPPTLLDFVGKADLRQHLMEGKHQEVGRRWYCALCQLAHSIIEDCPPLCAGCGRRHDEALFCAALEHKKRRERQEAQLANEAAAEGVSVDELLAARGQGVRDRLREERRELRAKAGRGEVQ